jgi:hypothetical protein
MQFSKRLFQVKHQSALALCQMWNTVQYNKKALGIQEVDKKF